MQIILMLETVMIEESLDDDLLPEYDFDYSKMRPNRFAQRFQSVAKKSDGLNSGGVPLLGDNLSR